MGRPCRLPFEAVEGEQRYSLTICTHRRQAYFINEATVERVTAVILRVGAREGFRVLAYCFMPDHVHLLIEGMNCVANLRRFVRSAKQAAGYEFTQRCGVRLWQEDYFDRTLRREDAVTDVLRYLLNNPIRAGLVESLDAYPHWGSGVCSRTELLEWICRS